MLGFLEREMVSFKASRGEGIFLGEMTHNKCVGRVGMSAMAGVSARGKGLLVSFSQSSSPMFGFLA